ncbi:MAG: 16S rRNA (uracil(1498)-N(3))-methyltransferase [Chthoniobacterales bacterium]
MHRFYLPPADWNADALVLSGSEAHHCKNVLRMKIGDKAVLFDGRGRVIIGEISAVRAREVHLRKSLESTTPPPGCQITLASAIPKGKKMDFIIEKAVEIGVSEIAPLVTNRTIVRLTAQEAAQKQTKWQAVAIEAAKQCGQNWLPQVHGPQTLEQFFAAAPRYDLRLVCSLQSDAVHLKTVLAGWADDKKGRRPATVLTLIGPEGDFTPAELDLARIHDCKPMTLGPIVLKVETATVYSLSILSYELLD